MEKMILWYFSYTKSHDRKGDIMALQLDQMVIFVVVVVPSVLNLKWITQWTSTLFPMPCIMKIINKISELQKILVKNSKALHI